MCRWIYLYLLTRPKRSDKLSDSFEHFIGIQLVGVQDYGIFGRAQRSDSPG